MSDSAERHAFLADIPLFAGLDEAIRLELARQLEPVHVAAGEVIFRQGDIGQGLFLVVSGRLRVSVASDISGDGHERVLYDVGRGAIVGEMALLTDRPRAATVSAVRDSDLLLLRVLSFTSLLERSPALVTGMIRLLVDRVVAVDQLLTVDRPRAAPPGHTIAVVSAGQGAGQSAGAAPARPRWSPGSWPRNWPGVARSSRSMPTSSRASWARMRRSADRTTLAGPS